jgi:parvulin-like peptidyl-prolyl isomerase
VQGLISRIGAICLALWFVACQQEPKGGSLLAGDITLGSAVGSQGVGSGMRGSGMRGSGMRGSANAHKSLGPDVDLDTKDILARTKVQDVVFVKHALLGWADLMPVYRGKMDARASTRTNADAAKVAKEVFDKLKAAPDTVDAVVKQHSEDPGSQSGAPYKVTEKSQFVPEFKKLALRLEDKEVGIVKTQFGYHVMIRVAKPPYDPIESSAIIERAPKTALAEAQIIMIGWKETVASKDPRAKSREKADADKLAKELLDKIKANGDMTKLMKEHSEDPGTKDTGRSYTVNENEPPLEQLKDLALRLDLGEAGIVKTDFGFLIVKRIKPDPLQSADILARTVPADKEKEKAKIKYILLGWKDAHIDDERGKKRERADLDKLVKDTLAKIAAKTKFEDLMKEHSEDKQTGATGMSIDATLQGLPPMLKMIGQRLKIDEVGVIKTQFGIFIVKRVDETAAQPTPPKAGSGSAAPPKAGSGSATPPKAGSAAGSGSAKKS